MSAPDDVTSLRDRLSRQGEEALGRLAEELAANPVVAGAVGRAFQARERAGQAQEAAMGALGIPSAADIERLTRRLRSVSQRLEGIEDALDRLEVRIDAMAATREGAGTGGGLAIEARLDEIVSHLSSVRAALGHETDPPSSAQERLAVTPPVKPATGSAGPATGSTGSAGPPTGSPGSAGSAGPTTGSPGSAGSAGPTTGSPGSAGSPIGSPGSPPASDDS